VLPKLATTSSCETDCGCDTTKKPLHKTFPFWSFWVGLVASIVFFTYFEIQNYNSEIQKTTASTEKVTEPCCATDEKCD
jgi:hypothetical protein